MSEEPHIERELKFSANLSELRERLLELEAERGSASAFEDNLVLDRGQALRKKGCLLRLRTDRHGARLTFKGPATFEDGVKVREERETRVDSSEAIRHILESAGFTAVAQYQKYREEWRLGSIVVALDHTPIGDFVEFEGEGSAKVAQRCGLDPAAAEPRSYLEIYADYRKEHPDAPDDMVFP